MEEVIKSYIGKIPTNLVLEPIKGRKTKFLFALLDEASDVDTTLEIPEDSEVEIAFVDLAIGRGKITFNIKMAEPHSSFHFHGAHLSKEGSTKDVFVNVVHEVGDNTALVENYGIAQGASHLYFKGDSHILNGAKKANTKQIAKIIVFDKGCKVSASPTLRIDENDVNASHAAIEGRLNDEHLFYLKSRGIDEKKAKELITLGYLKPIISYFEKKEADEILSRIEGEIYD